MTPLFSIECTTCHRTLQIRKKSAIGQIVNCPACGSMVQIVAPAGWVAPPDEPAAPPAAAKSSGTVEAKPASSAASPGSKSAVAAAAGQKPAGPGQIPTPEQLLAGVGEQPGFPWDKLILAGAVLTAVATLGIGIWVVSTTGKKPIAGLGTETTLEATSAPTGPVSTAAIPAATTGEATPAATVEATSQGTAVATGEATPAATPVGTAMVAPVTPVATAEAAPLPENPAMPMPGEEGPPVEPEAPRAPLGEATDVDVPGRMADPIKKIEFVDLPLAQAIDFVSQLTGLSITLDVDGIAQAGATPNDRVSAKLKDTTVGDLLETILGQRGLAYVNEGGRLRVTARADQAGAIQTIVFDVSDLTETDQSKADALAAMIRTMVTPSAWESDKEVKMTVEPGRITLQHHAGGCQPTAEFLDKLRLARGLKLPPSPVLAPRVVLETRITRVRDKLNKKMVGNFVDDKLSKPLKYIEKQTEMNLLVDNLALAKIGLTLDVNVSVVSVKDEPIWSFLDRLLDPLGLAYRPIDSQTLQITSRHAMEEQHDIEAYKIGDLVPMRVSLEEFLIKLNSLVEPGSWGEFNPGQTVFDERSGTLFVRHNQFAQSQIEDWLMTLRAPVKKGEPEKNGVDTPRAAKKAP